MGENKADTCVLVGTVKDEGPYLLEWLAYHKVIGFSKAYIYHNDCSDYTDDILRLLERFTNFVKQFENSERDENQRVDPQRRAYQSASRVDEVMAADYILVADADEFIHIKVGDGKLPDLFKAAGLFDVMSITWRFFGTSDITEIHDRPVLEQFQMARQEDIPDSVRLLGVKSLFNTNKVKRFGVHRPYHTHAVRYNGVDVNWINASGGQILDDFREGGWRVTRHTHGNDFAEINHYALRSTDSFLVKQIRGAANSGVRERLDLDYFETFNCNNVKETSIARHVPAILDQIKYWMKTVPGLAQAQAKTLAMHQETAKVRRKELMEGDPETYKALGLGDT